MSVELTIEAPLAKTEDFGDFQSYDNDNNNNNNNLNGENNSAERKQTRHNQQQQNQQRQQLNDDLTDNLTDEMISGSLEDLVNTFDEKITNCFRNYDDDVEKLAPVQVRTQDDIINECQMWWTLTGNYGNLLPIDWSKSYTRKLHLPALKLNSRRRESNRKQRNLNKENTVDNEHDNDNNNNNADDDDDDNDDDDVVDINHVNGNDLLNCETGSLDEEELAKDLDLHSLILYSLQQEPIFTAEQVLEEIDEIMQENSPTDSTLSEFSTNSECSNEEEINGRAGEDGDVGNVNTGDTNNNCKRTNNNKIGEFNSILYESKLRNLTIAQLNELFVELETMIQANSETLIQELAFRDELEFEKELKNQFISLLLGIQNKRRQHHIEKKRIITGNNLTGNGIRSTAGNEPKYLTTVIPYNPLNGPPNVATLQILIKILKAVNEDSPTVPTLLTDFILKVLCPT